MADRTKAHPNTESIDNYLKAILALGGLPERRVSGKELADHLHVAGASVTNMLQKLSALPEPLVDYEMHRGVRLSAAGQKRAVEVVRHHRLIETFLYEVLNYPLEEVHDEAERLEHFISERFEERIAAKLGHPKFDPHGHCIPALGGKMPSENPSRLSDASGEGTFLVESVEDRDPTTLRLLRKSGIHPGVPIEVRSRKADGHVKVKIGSAVLDLAPQSVRAIHVRPNQ